MGSAALNKPPKNALVRNKSVLDESIADMRQENSDADNR